MIDANNTTVDWQKFTGEVAILPIGSTEQHSTHLPISTDWLQADFMARKIAEKIDAALLPPIPYSNCLEHSGFRGSFSLKPETLMQVIHDLASEVERQNFKILIVFNGHGGNFSLIPALRDWNRLNRPLKILLVHVGDFYDHKLMDEAHLPGAEFHAGAWETSLMLAVRPDLVRPSPGEAMPIHPHEPFPLQRQDLTTFGLGHFNPTGAAGFPSKASVKIGQAIIDSTLTNIIPWLSNRIERLRKNPRYSGPGGIVVRPAILSDLPAAFHLKNLSGWNQTEADLAFFFKQFPTTYWVAVHNGKVIGTTTAAIYEQKMAWIGMVLVDPEFRRQGVGRLLMTAALEALRGVPCIKLDATPDGKKLYTLLDFKDEFILHRMTTKMIPPLAETTSPNVRPIQVSDLPTIINADQSAFGINRAALLTSLFQRAPHLAWMSQTTPTAFCLGRAGTNFTQIGPVVAPSQTIAQELIQAALRPLTGQPVVLDVPGAQKASQVFLKTMGFSAERTLIRMFRQENRVTGHPENLHAIAGPEFG